MYRRRLICLVCALVGQSCGARTGLLAPEAQPAERQLLALGADSSCAVVGDGELYCWGRNSDGQLGDGTTVARPLPTRVGAAHRWTAVWTGGTFTAHTCALERDATLWCWGSNKKGQLGRGDLQPALVPREVGGEWSDGAIGGAHTCAIQRDGSLWCWGWNDAGQAGVGRGYAVEQLDAPARVKTEERWLAVAAGYQHSCGVAVDRRLRCWGEGRGRELGAEINRLVDAPIAVGDARSWRVVHAGSLHSCALRLDGELWCWGQNGHGQLGGAASRTSGPVVIKIAGQAARWRSVAGGCAHTCAIRVDGAMFCWGNNDAGQTGSAPADASDPVVRKPTRVGQDSDWTVVAAGCKHSCGLKRGGEIQCWGANNYGQLGDGTRRSRHRARPVSLVR